VKIQILIERSCKKVKFRIMEYIVPEFTTLPTDDELRALLRRFIEVFGLTKWKVGMTGRKSLISRNSGIGIFKKLTEDNIFCTLKDYEVALKVENAMKEVLVEFDICANWKGDHTPGISSKNEERWVVYLVELNNDLRLCPMKGCNTVLVAASIVSHIDSHTYMVNLKKWKKMQREKGSDALDSLNTEPLPYHHDAYKSDHCRFCDMKWPEDIPMNQKQFHLSTCAANPLPFFKCRACGECFDRKRDLDKHLRKHEREAKQFERNFQYACKFCGQSFNDKWNRLAHEDRCKKNPAKPTFYCEKCRTPFLDKNRCRDHQAKCTLVSL
jgi:hypothetical protein